MLLSHSVIPKAIKEGYEEPLCDRKRARYEFRKRMSTRLAYRICIYTLHLPDTKAAGNDGNASDRSVTEASTTNSRSASSVLRVSRSVVA